MLNTKNIFRLGLLLASLQTLPLTAAVVSADLSEILDLPFYGVGGPRVIQKNGVVLPSPGPQLTAADEVSNPDSWSTMLEVSFDADTNLISLLADGTNTYQIISITLSNFVFGASQEVVGITPLSTGNTVIPASMAPALTTYFTANSVTIQYAVDTTSGDDFMIDAGGVPDTFQLVLRDVAEQTETPEPATSAVAGSVLAGVVVSRRRHA